MEVVAKMTVYKTDVKCVTNLCLMKNEVCGKWKSESEMTLLYSNKSLVNFAKSSKFVSVKFSTKMKNGKML